MSINCSCLNWYGGKGSTQQRRLLNKIITYINNRNENLFVDVFGGSGVVTMNINKKIQIYNDINNDLDNFFKVLQDDILSAKLQNILKTTLHSEKVYKDNSEEFHSNHFNTNCKDLNRAITFYIVTMQSINALGPFTKNTGFRATKSIMRKGMGQATSSFKTNVDINLPKCIEKFRTVEVHNDDFSICIDKFDSNDTIFYLDPPYVPETRTATDVYKNELSEERHLELINKLLLIKGKVILSGYDNSKYTTLENAGWNKEIIPIKTSSTTKGKKSTRTEAIWYNFNI